MRCGIDLIELRRIEKLLEKNPSFKERYFSEEEQELFNSREKNATLVAGNFALKEAFSKAMGTGIRGFSLRDIQVLRNELGTPEMTLSGKALEVFLSKGFKDIQCSISHDGDYVVGMVVIE